MVKQTKPLYLYSEIIQTFTYSVYSYSKNLVSYTWVVLLHHSVLHLSVIVSL